MAWDLLCLSAKKHLSLKDAGAFCRANVLFLQNKGLGGGATETQEEPSLLLHAEHLSVPAITGINFLALMRHRPKGLPGSCW